MGVEFTHLVTGKKVYIRNPKTIVAFIHGDGKNDEGKAFPGALWLVMENVPQSMPVLETFEEAKQKLGDK